MRKQVIIKKRLKKAITLLILLFFVLAPIMPSQASSTKDCPNSNNEFTANLCQKNPELSVLLQIAPLADSYDNYSQIKLSNFYYKNKILNHNHTKPFYYLNELFSSGLLNPRIH